MAGSPLGNKNAGSRPRIWSDAIRKAVLRRGKDKFKRLDKLADALLDECESGDVAALREFGDRIEGRVVQAISGPDGGAIIHTVERVIVEPK